MKHISTDTVFFRDHFIIKGKTQDNPRMASHPGIKAAACCNACLFFTHILLEVTVYINYLQRDLPCIFVPISSKGWDSPVSEQWPQKCATSEAQHKSQRSRTTKWRQQLCKCKHNRVHLFSCSHSIITPA